MKALAIVLGVLFVLATFYSAIYWVISYATANYPESFKYIIAIFKGFKDGNFESITQMILDDFTNSTRGDIDG